MRHVLFLTLSRNLTPCNDWSFFLPEDERMHESVQICDVHLTADPYCDVLSFKRAMQRVCAGEIATNQRPRNVGTLWHKHLIYCWNIIVEFDQDLSKRDPCESCWYCDISMVRAVNFISQIESSRGSCSRWQSDMGCATMFVDPSLFITFNYGLMKVWWETILDD